MICISPHFFRHPIFAQCIAPLSPSCVLAAPHPRGLLLLRRDEEDEEAFLMQAERRALALHEQGAGEQRRGPRSAWGMGERGSGVRETCVGLQDLDMSSYVLDS